MTNYKSSNQTKYHTSNPVKLWLLNKFLEKIQSIVYLINPSSLLDIGCGEALVLNKIHRIVPKAKLHGIDLNFRTVKQAQTNLPSAKIQQMNATQLKYKNNQFDTTLTLEVLEHLENPLLSIKEAQRVCKKFCIFSVPREPEFSILSLLAGLYINRLGRHPEHINYWNENQFLNLIKSQLPNSRIYSSFPWTIVVSKCK